MKKIKIDSDFYIESGSLVTLINKKETTTFKCVDGGYLLGFKPIAYESTFEEISDSTAERQAVIRDLQKGFWVPCDKVQSVLKLTFGEGLALFDFCRLAEWWSIVGKTEEERKRNGQKISTYFGLKGVSKNGYVE